MFKKFLKIQFFKFTLERFPNIFRPSSKPFVSGDTFRKLSDFIFDEATTFRPSQVKENSIVFLNPDLIDIYFHIQHEKINNNYYIITHNSHQEIGDYIEKYLDEKIIHWFALNLDIKNAKTTLIPMGLENLRRLRYGRIKWFKNAKNDKSKMIISSFDKTKNFDERSLIQEKLNESVLIDFITYSNYRVYFKNLPKYKFIICPQGKGYDTTRIWESLLLNVYPIFKENKFTLNLKELGIPAIYLKNWDDLNKLSKEELNRIYLELENKSYTDINNYQYWKNYLKNLN